MPPARAPSSPLFVHACVRAALAPLLGATPAHKAAGAAGTSDSAVERRDAAAAAAVRTVKAGAVPLPLALLAAVLRGALLRGVLCVDSGELLLPWVLLWLFLLLLRLLRTRS